MACLDPDGAARITPGPVHAGGRVAQPAACRIGAVLVLENTSEHKDFLAAGVAVGLKHRARCPAHQGNVLRSVGVQGQHLQPAHQARQPDGLGGVDHQPLLIGRVHLLQFHQDRAAASAEGGVAGAHGIAQVGAGAVIAVLIREGAFQHQNFLAAAMGVALKTATGGVAHDRGGPGHLAPAAIEQASFHPRQGRWGPVQRVAVQHGALVEIGIELHGSDSASAGFRERLDVAKLPAQADSVAVEIGRLPVFVKPTNARKGHPSTFAPGRARQTASAKGSY